MDFLCLSGLSNPTYRKFVCLVGEQRQVGFYHLSIDGLLLHPKFA